MNTILNSAAFAWVFSGIVLGSVGMYAWHVAYIFYIQQVVN